MDIWNCLQKGLSLLFISYFFPEELVRLILWFYFQTHIVNPIIKICSYRTHSLCTINGVLYSSGSNSRGQLFSVHEHANMGYFETTHSNVIDMGCGDQFSIIHTNEGLFGCGANDFGQLGLGRYTARVNIHQRIALYNVLSISCGKNFTLIQTKTGLYSTGSNEFGALGYDTDYCDRCDFGKIDIPDTILSFRCFNTSVFVLTLSGLYTFGKNQDRELGHDYYYDNGKYPQDRYTYSILTPRKVSLDNIISYYNGNGQSMILTKDGLYITHRLNKKLKKMDLSIWDTGYPFRLSNILDYVFDYNNIIIVTRYCTFKKSHNYTSFEYMDHSFPVTSLYSSMYGIYFVNRDECYFTGEALCNESWPDNRPVYRNSPIKLTFHHMEDNDNDNDYS